MSGFSRRRSSGSRLGIAVQALLGAAALAGDPSANAAVHVPEKPAATQQGTTAESRLPSDPELKNDARLTLDILPSAEVELGTKLSFVVASKRSGYVVLVDVDPTGRVTQFLPNFLSLGADGLKEGPENRIAPNAPTTFPQPGAKTYEFVASPPVGVGLVVAIFSETSLDIVDLPNVPAGLVGQAEAAAFLGDAASSLMIMSPDGSEFHKPSFSFSARFYRVR